MIYDAAVVGAGFGGLAAAADLTSKGYNVVVFEASNELGGSAGKFERNGYRFQSGATVGMGFEPGGVLDSLFGRLGIEKPSMKSLDIIMDVHLPDRTIHYYRDRNEWYKEMARVFEGPGTAFENFYDEVFKVGRLVDQLTDKLPVFPPRTWGDYAHLLPLVNESSLRLLPYMTQTVEDRLKKHGLDQHRMFRTFLNGELMDSVQTSVENCPAFLGFAALQTFHKGAFAVHGGLAEAAGKLAAYIREHDGDVLMRHPVHSIEKGDAGFTLHSKRNSTFEARQVILNNSVHNLHDTLTEELSSQSYIRPQKETAKKAWGAFIIHGGVDADVFRDTDVLYHQFIDPDHPDDLHNGGQFLLSLSDLEDTRMAPEGKRSFTLSTHTDISPWWEAGNYEDEKRWMKEKLLRTVDHYFEGFTDQLDLVLPGTPVTFQKWLRRRGGKVGGYAPTGKYSWLTSYSVRTGIPDLYQCGDTVFPGAGTLGVTLSGLMAAKQAAKGLK